MDCVEQLSTHQPVFILMVSLFFINKYLTVIVTGQEVMFGDMFSWLPNEVSKAESLLSWFGQHEEVLLDWICLPVGI